MLVFRKAQYALQNAFYKSLPTSTSTSTPTPTSISTTTTTTTITTTTTTTTKRSRTAVVSIPLRQLLLHEARDVPAPPVLPAEIWFLVLELLDRSVCPLCKNNLLCTLALVSRVFNEFATKALYHTLDLRFSGECNLSHPCLKELYWFPKPHIAKDILKRKLDKLDRTLRVPQGPVSLVRHLKLPEVNITKHPSSAQNILDVLPNWVAIFELCSSRLESVSGLGNLWSYLHHFNRSELRTRLCDAIGNNPHWTEWDWLWDSWGYAWWSALTEEPRILEMYRGWKHIRHISIDTAEWASSVLGFLSELRSLSVECGEHVNDLRGIFQQVPLRGLESLVIKAWVPLPEVLVDFDHTEPLNPLIDYLERCSAPSPNGALPSSFSSSILTNLDIRCCWPGSHIPGLRCFYPKSVCLDDFLFSIFTLAPLLRAFKLDLRMPHEEAVRLPGSRCSTTTTSTSARFVARNLRSMTISIPSQNSKAWLAAQIASGAFPKLSCFVFRSSMTRRGGGCVTMFCKCTLSSSSGFLALNDFGREQDAALVKACQEAGVPEWEMQILHVNLHPCFSFTIEDMLEDDQSLYFGKNTHRGWDPDDADDLGRTNVRNIKSPYLPRSRGIVCDIQPYRLER